MVMSKLIDLPSATMFWFLEMFVISFQSWKQKTFIIFSTKAKYNYATSVVKERIWLCQLLVNLSCHQPFLIIIFCDNQFSNLLFKDPKFHNRSKHIAFRYHYLHKKMNFIELRLGYTLIEWMKLDIFTSPLPRIFLPWA